MQALEKSVQQLQAEISACRKCRSLFAHEPRPRVWGKAHAPVLLIGQAPSRKVHETGRPFNDQSGRRLRRWLDLSEAQFWNQDFLYITAMAQCFPGKAPKGGGDLKPPAICAQTWLPRLMDSLGPELYLIVGSYAARHFFPGRPLPELVFSALELHHKPAYVLPHPSPLNQKWLKDYPEFEKERTREIRQQLHRLMPA
jgi:uracil-DNA glycosylase family 4